MSTAWHRLPTFGAHESDAGLRGSGRVLCRSRSLATRYVRERRLKDVWQLRLSGLLLSRGFRYSLRMPQTRLELALSLIEGGDWRVFEKFTAEFLAVDYPEMRTTASASGDGGRDAELYVPLGDPTTAIQISVRQDWEAKIRETVKRLADTFPSVRELIYATNQAIGASADDLKKSLRRDPGISLDVRDRQWYVERENTYPQRSIASERLAEQFVNPLLKRAGAAPTSAKSLSGPESRVALLQLALDSQDVAGDRNLTKSCFESLVVAALRGTSAENRMPRAQVHSAIGAFVPAGAPGQLEALIDGALARLAKKGGPIKHFRQADEFHLSYEESVRIDEQAARFLLDERELEAALVNNLRIMADTEIDEQAYLLCGPLLRETLEKVLLQQSEEFAAAVSTGESLQLDAERLFAEVKAVSSELPTTAELAAAAIREVLAVPTTAMSAHLRRLSDSYTLFAFLRQTPDVQKVVLSVFSEGDIWLDTSAILPLIAEELVEAPERRFYTQLLRAAANSGLNLFVTPGVIEEVERHLNKCVAFSYSRSGEWNGRVPFVYSAYLLSGRPRGEFVAWQDQIRGKERPLDDVRDYLDEVFSIQEKSLEEFADRGDIELRAAVQELWSEQHDQRRGAGDDYATDPLTVGRLVAHDVENTVGVLELRKSEQKGPMGYRTWWLTMDKTALRIKAYLRERMGQNAPTSSPALSPDFLSQYLRLGPMRSALEKGQRVSLPLITDVSRIENIPKSLIAISDAIRRENAELDERVLRRKVRDQMDYERTRLGVKAQGGIHKLETEIKAQIANNI